MAKPKLAIYWASSCGGCEVAVVNLHLGLLEVDRHFDFVFCPCLLDTKTRDVEALADGAIAITLFNGAIRNSHNLEMARLLRRKSALLVAFGACSTAGGIPALSNLHSREEHWRTIYGGAPPRPRSHVPEGDLELPEFFERVRTLGDAVEVDYFIPGCPPEPAQVWKVVEALVAGGPLPARGSVLGGGVSSVCRECAREKNDKRVAGLVRAHEIVADRERCLLEQGVVCMGIATRDGCGARCPAVNMPCTGCYGPPDGVRDQGAKMIAALGSVLDAAQRQEIADPAGVFYKFSLAGSLAGGKRP